MVTVPRKKESAQGNRQNRACCFVVRDFLLKYPASREQAFVLTALSLFAQPDGSRIYPGRDNLLRLARIRSETMKVAIDYWLGTGVLVLVAEARPKHAAEYRIDLPRIDELLGSATERRQKPDSVPYGNGDGNASRFRNTTDSVPDEPALGSRASSLGSAGERQVESKPSRKSKPSSSHSRESNESDVFWQEFWETYPGHRKGSESETRALFYGLGDALRCLHMLDMLRAWKSSDQWSNPRYVPKSEKFLTDSLYSQVPARFANERYGAGAGYGPNRTAEQKMERFIKNATIRGLWPPRQASHETITIQAEGKREQAETPKADVVPDDPVGDTEEGRLLRLFRNAEARGMLPRPS
jgi:hypothetical protein